MSRNRLWGLIVMIVCFLTPWAFGQTKTAKITFFDGSSIELSNPRFVYKYRPRSLINFSNTYHSTSTSFHYIEQTNSRSVPIDKIQEITITYRQESHTDATPTLVLERLTITQIDGQMVTVNSDLFGEHNELPSNFAGRTDDPALFWELLIEGQVAVNGRQSGFTRILMRPGHTSFMLRAEKRDETCGICALPNTVVRTISFVPRRGD